MLLQVFFQLRFIQPGLLEHLFDARLVLGPTNAGGNGHDVFGAENFRRHAFVINVLGFTHGFLGQSVGGEKLHLESARQKMLALDLLALSLQMRVDGRDASDQTVRRAQHVG